MYVYRVFCYHLPRPSLSRHVPQSSEDGEVEVYEGRKQQDRGPGEGADHQLEGHAHAVAIAEATDAHHIVQGDAVSADLGGRGGEGKGEGRNFETVGRGRLYVSFSQQKACALFPEQKEAYAYACFTALRG